VKLVVLYGKIQRTIRLKNSVRALEIRFKEGYNIGCPVIIFSVLQNHPIPQIAVNLYSFEKMEFTKVATYKLFTSFYDGVLGAAEGSSEEPSLRFV
jgi:hypothetical protein